MLLNFLKESVKYFFAIWVVFAFFILILFIGISLGYILSTFLNYILGRSLLEIIFDLLL